MRVNTGRGWQEMGPGSAKGITGHRSSMMVALEEPRSPTGMAHSTMTGRCVVCQEPTLPGRFACGPDHQKVAYGDRR